MSEQKSWRRARERRLRRLEALLRGEYVPRRVRLAYRRFAVQHAQEWQVRTHAQD